MHHYNRLCMYYLMMWVSILFISHVISWHEPSVVTRLLLKIPSWVLLRVLLNDGDNLIVHLVWLLLLLFCELPARGGHNTREVALPAIGLTARIQDLKVWDTISYRKLLRWANHWPSTVSTIILVFNVRFMKGNQGDTWRHPSMLWRPGRAPTDLVLRSVRRLHRIQTNDRLLLLDSSLPLFQKGFFH